MSLRVGEVGKKIRVNCDLDLSSYSQLTIVFTKPDGTTTVTKTTSDGVTAPSTAVTSDLTDSAGDYIVFAANEYMEYTVESGFLDTAGTWSARAQYDDATPNTYIGDTTTFTVLPTS